MSSIAIPFPRTRHRRWTVGALGQVLRVVSTVGLLAAVGVWALFLRPQFFAGPATYVMVSGVSMEPTLHHGDLVVAHRQDHYRVGDAVVYRVPAGETGAGSLIIHRIIGGSAASGWIVQGDNKDVPDLWRPKPGDVVGSMWTSVPGAGSVLARGMSPFALASISTLLALFIGLPGAAANAAEARSRRRRQLGGAQASSEIATALALTAPPRPRALPAPRTDRALAVPSLALAPALPKPAGAVPVWKPRDEILELAPGPLQLALPPAAVSRSPLPSVSCWGEAAWTARDLRSPAL